MDPHSDSIVFTSPLRETDPPFWLESFISVIQEDSEHEHIASEVLPRLYLTDIFIARDEAQLTSLGITHVVSALEWEITLPQTQSLRILHIPISDDADADILKHLPDTTSFISNALAENPNSRVLVSPWWLLCPFPCS